MTNGSTNVIDLMPYVNMRETSYDTPLPSAAEFNFSTSEQSKAGGSLNANAVLRLDPQTDLSKFLTLASDAIEQLERTQERTSAKDLLGADDELMASRRTISELLVFRDLSDGLGLVLVKCFLAVGSLKTIIDGPLVPEVVRRALMRVSATPFMKFEDACYLADEIERVAPSTDLPGYSEIAAELIADAAISDAV